MLPLRRTSLSLIDDETKPGMAKRKPEVRIRTFGIYTQWDSDAKELPKVQEVTLRVPAHVDIEFGMVVNILKAKNQRLFYRIDHPGIRDDDGRVRDPFVGEVFIRTNDWDFYLGDTVWEPLDDKIGPWRMTLELGGKLVAEKTFDVYHP